MPESREVARLLPEVDWCGVLESAFECASESAMRCRFVAALEAAADDALAGAMLNRCATLRSSTS